MNIEILGVDPRNKGAALMLEAIKQQILEIKPTASFCVRLSFNSEERLKYGLWGLLPRDTAKKRLIANLAERFLPTSFFGRLGLVKDNDIDLVLDSSGFAYGDFWGVEKLNKRLGRNVAKWKNQNKKIVLLPQAWGAFEKVGFKDVLNKIADNVDLMFARDGQSLAHLLNEIGTERKNVLQAPDFTCLLKPLSIEALADFEGSTFIIPNEKVVKSFGDGARQQYLEYLATCCNALIQHGHRLVILNHEGVRDEKLAHDLINVAAMGDSNIQVLSLDDPLATKFVLSRARCIISSRFHGLVSALSSGVPSLAVGWSHKYEELLKDYECEEFVVDFLNSEASHAQLNSFITAVDEKRFPESLKERSESQKLATEKMWQKVAGLLSD